MKIPTVEEWESHLEEIGVDQEPDLLNLPQNRFLAPLVKPGMEILDAGSGNGRYLFAFAKAGANAVGVDFSVRLTEMVKTQARKMALDNVTAIKADMMALPFDENRFDLYTSFGVYEHFTHTDHKRLFAEAFRVLKPGGQIYLEVPQFWSMWTVRRELRYWFRKLRPPTLVWQRNMRRNYVKACAATAGFKNMESHVFDAWYGFEKGFSLKDSKLLSLPNPFYLSQSLFLKAAKFCDSREWLGHTLVFIGKKPGV